MTRTKENGNKCPASPEIWDVARLYIGESKSLSKKQENALLGAIRNRNVTLFLKLCDGLEYSTAQACKEARQLEAFFKKNASFSLEDVCLETAKSSFLAAELLCRETNDRLDRLHVEPIQYPQSEDQDWFNDRVAIMQRDIAAVLWQPWEKKRPNPLDGRLKITQGATADRSRKRSLAFLKATGKLVGPTRAWQYIVPDVTSMLSEADTVKYTAQDFNRIEFVPKNYKTHRTIACEPTHVAPYQELVGRFMTERLGQWGITLHDQHKNQEMAREGSLDGSFATIDMAAASDTVSQGVVALLVPEWFLTILEDLRSPYGYFPAHGYLPYAKFSSMGNGYTFPLETMIFAAAVRAVSPKGARYAVYGDDMIVEEDSVGDLVKLLNYLGFKVNPDKSFWMGNFRESCGADWYNGELVTPFYVRKTPNTKSEMSHFVNGLLAVCVPVGAVWAYLRTFVREWKLLLVPFNSDSRSGVMIDPADARVTRLMYVSSKAKNKALRGYQSAVFRGYGPSPVQRNNKGWRAYLIWFFEISAQIDFSKTIAIFGIQDGSNSDSRWATRNVGNLTSEATGYVVHTLYKHQERVWYPVCNKVRSPYLYLVYGFLKSK